MIVWRTGIMAFFATVFVQTCAVEIVVKSGDKTAFCGDSITVGGWINITATSGGSWLGWRRMKWRATRSPLE